MPPSPNTGQTPGFGRVGQTPPIDAPSLTFGGKSESVAQRTTRVLAELQKRRPNGYYEGAVVWDEIKLRDGRTQAVIHIGDPYNAELRLVKTLPTELTKEEVDKIRARVSWTREMCKIIYTEAVSYEARMPLIIQGESAIGKSFGVNIFSKLLSGTKPETFDCNGQTDSGDLMAKPVPNTGQDSGTQGKIDAFLKSRVAKEKLDTATKEALDLDENLRVGYMQEQLEELVRSSGLSGANKAMFRMQLGAIPKAMCWKKGADGKDEYPETGGTGKILHIQEVTLAKGSIINIVLALRGEGRKVATELQLWQDKGQILHAGSKYWFVMTANPFDGDGFQEREPLDKALMRGCVVLKMGDLCEESWLQLCKEVCGFSLGNLPDELPINCEVEYYKNAELVNLIAETLSAFHLEYKQALATDPVEKEREEKVMASQDDISQVAQMLLANQVIDTNGSVDMAATFKEAIKKTYLDRHLVDADEDDDGTKKDSPFANRMELALETMLNKKETGSIRLSGKTMTRGQAMNELCSRMSLPPDQRAKIAEAGVRETVQSMDSGLASLLGL